MFGNRAGGESGRRRILLGLLRDQTTVGVSRSRNGFLRTLLKTAASFCLVAGAVTALLGALGLLSRWNTDPAILIDVLPTLVCDRFAPVSTSEVGSVFYYWFPIKLVSIGYCIVVYHRFV